MKALLLEDASKFVLKELREPVCSRQDVLLQVGAVGVCGTDFHIYSGHANYNFDANGKPIPLQIQPQILGHEFCGTVVEVGRAVDDIKVGDRVAVDQGLNCFSQSITPPCEYCETGYSHQCANYKERGITGLPGAMQEFITMPHMNVVPVNSLSFEEAALSEPLGCIIHAVDVLENAALRYTLPGSRYEGQPVENVLILGAGPAGLLFLQYIRQVKGFRGRIFVADVIEDKLRLAERFGGTSINVRQTDLVQAIREMTDDVKIHLVIEASGHGSVFETMPGLLRKQGTVLLYGHGHEGTDMSILNRLLFLEPSLVVSCGASGKLDPKTLRSETTRRAVELVQSGKIEVKTIITHRYRALEEIDQAFREDSKQKDYVKGVLSMSA